MAVAKFIHDGDSINYTPTSADVAAGDVIVQGDLVGIAKRDIPRNVLGALAVSGVFDLPKARGVGAAIAAGAKVYWDALSQQATTTADDNKYLGKAVRTAADADATVRVRLEQMRTAHCSSPVEYRRPPEFWTVQATFGKTGFEVADESGLTIKAQVWDFLILADALPGIEPEPGDVIAANGRRYEVMNLGGEGCWRWSDPYRQTYRIHTKDIGADT